MIFITKRNVLALAFIILSFFLCRCKPKFSVNADSESFTVVYGLLDVSEKTQYVKVLKSFLVEGSAYDVVKDINRYSYIDSIEVRLNEYDARNNRIREISFDTTTNIPKDSGLFLYPTQILYTTNAELKFNKDYTYEIEVFNRYTKNITKSKVPFSLAGNVSITRPLGSELSITDKGINVLFYTGENTTMYQLLLKYYYTETLNDNTNRQPEPVVWTLGTIEDIAAVAGKEKELSISAGTGFFMRIAESIHENANVVSRHTDSIVLEVHSAAKDWALYLKSNLPSTGVNQDKLRYSNMRAYNTETGEEKYAMGIFSSRMVTAKKYNDLTVPGGSRDSLFHGRFTGRLKFTDIY